MSDRDINHGDHSQPQFTNRKSLESEPAVRPASIHTSTPKAGAEVEGSRYRAHADPSDCPAKKLNKSHVIVRLLGCMFIVAMPVTMLHIVATAGR